MHETVDRDLIGELADMLDYPHSAIDACARGALERARAVDSEAAALVERFSLFLETTTVDELQEAYTRAFDLDTLSEVEPTWYPYVGHQLVEDHSKRSAFLVELASRYKDHGFTAGTELPDHIVVVLRFASLCPDEELVQELVHEGLVPALGRAPDVGEALPTSGREHYLALLTGLRKLLEAQPSWALASAEPGEAELAMAATHDPYDPRRR